MVFPTVIERFLGKKKVFNLEMYINEALLTSMQILSSALLWFVVVTVYSMANLTQCFHISF